MATISKRMRKAAELGGDLKKGVSLQQAVELLQKMPAAKFDETVEVSASLLVDPKQSNQMVRGTVSLPHGSGKKVSVLVFTDNADAALEAGADFAGLEDMIAKIQEGWLGFDVAIATPAAMAKVKPVARVLGPRGMMPNPKSGTVTDDIPAAIKAVKAGRVEYKMDKTANVSIVVGKRSFSAEALLENSREALSVLVKSRPEALKGKFIRNVTLSATMSPGIRVENAEINSLGAQH